MRVTRSTSTHLVNACSASVPSTLSLAPLHREMQQELRKLSTQSKSVSGRVHHRRLDYQLKEQLGIERERRTLHLRSGEAECTLPSDVYHDLQSLVQSRRVSDVLGSAVRRQALEISLAENIERHRSRHQPSRRRQAAEHAERPRPQPREQYPVPNRDQSRIVSQLRESPGLRRLGPEQREAVLAEVGGLIQRGIVRRTLGGELRGHLELHLQEMADRSRNGVTREDFVRSLERRRRRPGARIPAPSPRQRYRVPQRDQSQIMRVLRDSPSLARLGREEREAILSDVGGLVQQRLVSNALSGEFRGVLEVHIQQRAERVSQGVGPQELLRSLERRRERGGVREPMPTVHEEGRVGGVSREEYRQLQRDMTEMRSQLTELHQLVRTSFDLQLDIQRSIRQEVSAAMHSALSVRVAALQSAAGQPASIFAAAAQPLPNPGAPQLGLHQQPPPNLGAPQLGLHQQPPPNPGAPQPAPRPPRSASNVASPSPIVSPGHCVICLQAEVDCALYRCGHMCVDMQCALELRAQSLKCPICRAPIVDVIRTYSA